MGFTLCYLGNYLVSGSPGHSGVRVVTRRSLFDKMKEQNLPNFEEKLNYLENWILSSENYSEDELKALKHKFSHIKSEFKQRWKKADKTEARFLHNNDEWLKNTFEIQRAQPKSSGRPSKPFNELSERSKRRKTETLRITADNDMLIHAAQTNLQTSGKKDASSILKQIMNSPTRATKLKKAYKTVQDDKEKKLTPLSALSVFVEADLTRRQYEIIRSASKKLFPSYSILQKAKSDCYPPKESYEVTETCVQVNLQDVLNHTATRLLTYLKDVLRGLRPDESDSLELFCKWGCDGSQQAQFKQKMENDATDSNIFQSSFVPLRLVCGTKTVWQNPTPSSPRYCRPIRIRFLKETVDITQEEIEYVENAINALQKTTFLLEEKSYSVKHTMMLTMVDAKVCNAATQTTSTMRCYICGASSKELNDLTIKRDVDADALSFGLSTLHARIRLFESILHLSYKLTVKKWQLRSNVDKAIVKERKKIIQEKFRRETGLIVDVPKVGFGNTNDGNTSRRFFSNPELAAEITGVDYNFIYRLKVILEVISSGHKVHLDKFADYCIDTAKLYISLYPWHPMTPTMHKILVHGATVIDKALLPIGLLSEEAAEARNKHFRLYRQNFARKFSRVKCNTDIINRLLLSSDPLITGMRPTPKKRTLPFTKEAIALMIPAVPDSERDSYSDLEEVSGGTESDEDDEEPWDSSSL